MSLAPSVGVESWSFSTRIGPPHCASMAPRFTSSIVLPGASEGSHSIARPSRSASPSARMA
jgi:hypothetical protein